MLKRIYRKNQKGFTLLEMMAVLVIMGVMFSIAINKFDLLSDSASISAIKAGVRELNTRETLIWTRIKLSDAGWSSDDDLFIQVDTDLGKGYTWTPNPPTRSGATLLYKSQSAVLTRAESTNNSVGSWQTN